MRAVFLDYGSIGPADIDAAVLKTLLPKLEFHATTAPQQLSARLADAEIVFVNKIHLGRDVLTEASQLKLICVSATGTDIVDLQAARELGIAVTNIRNYCTPSVVEHVFALLLSLTRQLTPYRQLMQSGAWADSPHFCLLDFPIRELAGKTLGIIGYGALGQAVATAARGFGMQVMTAKRPYDPDDLSLAGPGDAEPTRCGFGQVLASADVLSLHCPLVPATRHLINARTLKRMRSDALLINTARGGLVESQSLLAALRDRRLGGAGIDVLELEPPPPDDPLVTAALPHLIVTPHIAWAAREARQRAVEELAANVSAFLRGDSRNRID